MGNNLKSSSFRLKEDNIEKFRGFAKDNGLNQAEMFNARYNEAIALKEESLKLALEREENKRISIENELAVFKMKYND